MFTGFGIGGFIILSITLVFVGVAVLSNSRDQGAAIALILTGIVIFGSQMGPACRSCTSSKKIKTSSSSSSVSTKVECKGSKLCDKLEELTELRLKLSAKKEEINKLIKEYSASIKQLEIEIRTEQRSKRINSYAQAKDNQRISYDLALIQRKTAYISKLEEISPKLDNGANELEFLQRQTEDDIKMEQVLGDKEIEKLAAKIEATIAKYLPDAGELAIEIDKDSIPSAESIWQKISGD
ncbi:MAG: hypothetical protein NTX82_03880 [Candidatus Parcubacteria bacterium]|nr:hypothetical protein [Candidatus Parcubacteria bacterium]